jgi:hypothetical protein
MDNILLIVSLILFILASVGVNAGRISLVAAGLAFYVASILF